MRRGLDESVAHLTDEESEMTSTLRIAAVALAAALPMCAIGSGGAYALAAARALVKHSKLGTKDLALEAMRIASEICIYTNENFTVEEI